MWPDLATRVARDQGKAPWENPGGGLRPRAEWEHFPPPLAPVGFMNAALVTRSSPSCYNDDTHLIDVELVVRTRGALLE